MEDEDPVQIPITHELDLHTFRPSEIGELLPEYFNECRKLGLRRVLIIHGKGTGALREGVHRLLEKSPDVISFQHPAEAQRGCLGRDVGELEIPLTRSAGFSRRVFSLRAG